MTKEEAKQFYATILSGLLSNDGVGGNIDDKIKLALLHGDKLAVALDARWYADAIRHKTLING